jgi:hypothetical protein
MWAVETVRLRRAGHPYLGKPHPMTILSGSTSAHRESEPWIIRAEA